MDAMSKRDFYLFTRVAHCRALERGSFRNKIGIMIRCQVERMGSLILSGYKGSERVLRA